MIPSARLAARPARFYHVAGAARGVPLVDFAVERIQQAERGAAHRVKAQTGAAEELAAVAGVAEQPLFIGTLVAVAVEDQVRDLDPARVDVEDELRLAVGDDGGGREVAEVDHRAGNAEKAAPFAAEIAGGNEEGAGGKLHADRLLRLFRPLVHRFDGGRGVGFAVGDGAEVEQRQAVKIVHHAAPVKALAGEVHAAVVFRALEAADKLAAAHFQPFMPAFQLDFRPFEQRAGFAQLFNRGDLANQLIPARLRQTLAERRLARSVDVGNVKQRVAVFVFHRH